MKTSLTFRDGRHSRRARDDRRGKTVAYIVLNHRGSHVGIDKGRGLPARLYAKDCRELAAWLIEAADEMERRGP